MRVGTRVTSLAIDPAHNVDGVVFRCRLPTDPPGYVAFRMDPQSWNTKPQGILVPVERIRVIE